MKYRTAWGDSIPCRDSLDDGCEFDYSPEPIRRTAMKVDVYVYAKVENWRKDVCYYAYFTGDIPGNHMGTLIAETSVEIDEPNIHEIIDGTVKTMRAEQQKIRAEAEVKYQNIEQQIQEMLCLSAPVEQETQA